MEQDSVQNWGTGFCAQLGNRTLSRTGEQDSGIGLLAEQENLRILLREYFGVRELPGRIGSILLRGPIVCSRCCKPHEFELKAILHDRFSCKEMDIPRRVPEADILAFWAKLFSMAEKEDPLTITLVYSITSPAPSGLNFIAVRGSEVYLPQIIMPRSSQVGRLQVANVEELFSVMYVEPLLIWREFVGMSLTLTTTFSTPDVVKLFFDPIGKGVIDTLQLDILPTNRFDPNSLVAVLQRIFSYIDDVKEIGAFHRRQSPDDPGPPPAYLLSTLADANLVDRALSKMKRGISKKDVSFLLPVTEGGVTYLQRAFPNVQAAMVVSSDGIEDFVPLGGLRSGPTILPPV